MRFFNITNANFKAAKTAPNSIYTIAPNIVFQQITIQQKYAPI